MQARANRVYTTILKFCFKNKNLFYGYHGAIAVHGDGWGSPASVQSPYGAHSRAILIGGAVEHLGAVASLRLWR